MAVILSLTTDGPDATRALGAVMGADLAAGDVLALSGELGAGKTCLVQGLARGLGLEGPVTSPTFVLVRTLTGGRIPLVHVDVYRLDQLSDVEGLGDDVLAPDVVTVIEWGDTVDALLPEERLLVEIEHGDHPDQRVVSIRGADHWEQRAATWRDALGDAAGTTLDVGS
ncbi:MAG: tRNA (adenosine(37)-N6)-threonylcarbamoyltransferase complex ATPase subunit type 1 TsaE [Nitriliruptorales bacterium]|nr:tRNA (adenosine(37)-N6)-threonylcarbamoyltransferase complex ATPase subunit type 1 TsaE [Nitriliruptorales bacterium]